MPEIKVGSETHEFLKLSFVGEDRDEWWPLAPLEITPVVDTFPLETRVPTPYIGRDRDRPPRLVERENGDYATVRFLIGILRRHEHGYDEKSMRQVVGQGETVTVYLPGSDIDGETFTVGSIDIGQTVKGNISRDGYGYSAKPATVTLLPE